MEWLLVGVGVYCLLAVLAAAVAYYVFGMY